MSGVVLVLWLRRMAMAQDLPISWARIAECMVVDRLQLRTETR